MRERAVLPGVAAVLAASLMFGPAAAAACALLCGETGEGEHGAAALHADHSDRTHAGHTRHGQTAMAGHAGHEPPAEDQRVAAPASGRASVGVEATARGCCDHPGMRARGVPEALAAESQTERSRTTGSAETRGSPAFAPAPADGAFRAQAGSPPPGSVRAPAPGLSRTVVLRL